MEYQVNMKRGIEKAIATAEQAFFENNVQVPDLIIFNPDGMALLTDEVGYSVFDDDFKYKDMYVAVCSHPNFPIFKLAYSNAD